MYSFYIKQKDIAGNPRYTEEEQTLVRMLEDGPLSLAETAHALHTDVYKLNLPRLKDEVKEIDPNAFISTMHASKDSPRPGM